MQRTLLTLILLGTCLLGFSSLSWATTVYLKDGRVLKGEIVEQTPQAVTVKVGKQSHRYNIFEVDRIIEDEMILENTLGIDPKGFEGIHPYKAQMILVLMEANGTLKNIEKNIDNVFKDVPEQYKGVLGNIFDAKEMMKSLVPVYDKYYSEEELKQLVNFYQSPAGKKFLEVTPEIVEETMQANIKYLQDKMMKQKITQ